MTWDMYINQMKAEEYERGKVQGIVGIMRSMVDRGRGKEEILELTATSQMKDIESLYNLITRNADKSDEELVAEYCKKSEE